MSGTTKRSAAGHDGYVLGRSDAEYERLRSQAQMWEAETVRLLDRAGLTPGARCLDVGCGPGEVMRLMAECVGPEGEVLGVDVDGELGAQALAMLSGNGHRNCRFAAFDVERDPREPGGRFDLVCARLLLIHTRDPAAVLARLWEWVAPGGWLVVQDYDLLSGEVVPELDLIEDFKRVALGAFWGSGRDVRLGLRLPALHLEAGIGAPDCIDAGVRIGPLPGFARMYEAVYRSLLPVARELGIVTAQEAEEWFAEFADRARIAGEHTVLWPLLIGTATRKPG